jgi:hypothetical protein
MRRAIEREDKVTGSVEPVGEAAAGNGSLQLLQEALD